MSDEEVIDRYHQLVWISKDRRTEEFDDETIEIIRSIVMYDQFKEQLRRDNVQYN